MNTNKKKSSSAKKRKKKLITRKNYKGKIGRDFKAQKVINDLLKIHPELEEFMKMLDSYDPLMKLSLLRKQLHIYKSFDWFEVMRDKLKDEWDAMLEVKKCKTGTFYIIRMTSKKESFIKIGITSSSVKQRYHDFKAYDIEILRTHKKNIRELFDFETFWLKKLYKHNLRYSPKKRMTGKTECFTLKSLEILSELKK